MNAVRRRKAAARWTGPRCLDCHRPLRDPLSIAAKRGRSCREEHGITIHAPQFGRRPAPEAGPEQLELDLTGADT